MGMRSQTDRLCDTYMYLPYVHVQMVSINVKQLDQPTIYLRKTKMD